MKKLLKMILCDVMLICGVTTLSSCNTNSSENPTTITVTDMEGTEVTISNDVDHVACISPSATDFMISFGLGDKIVGTYRSFTYNSWAIEMYPSAANYRAYSYSVSAEELLADEIDLVIIQDTENAESFRNAGIPVIGVHQYSPTGAFDDEVFDTARLIGDIFGGDAKIKADAWIKDVEDTISDIQNEIGITNSEEPIYYVNGEKAKGLYYSDGGNSMISRIYDVANVRLATEKYEVLNVHEVSDEEMISLNPYAIMIGGAYQNILSDELTTSEVWSNLDCNKEDRVYRIPVCMLGIENVSCETPVMLKYTASLFNDYDFDITVEVKENIKKYFDYELTDSDVQNMIRGLDKDGNDMINE
jgi:ABC-type Fe3+-hydroxamate transport system substrate-binding protein